MSAMSVAASPLHNRNIGFIGAGAMASAIIKGLLASGISPGRISASDPWEPARAKAKALGLNVTGNAEVAIVSEIIVVAVKPDVVASALAPLELRGKLVVSIAAGVPLMAIEIAAGNGARCVRTMPNTPCLVGEAAVGVARGATATDADVATAMALFRGVVVEVPEKQLNAVTAVSGSGPAYIFLLIEALADGGVKAGLPRATALELAAQTVKGAAAMQLATGTHPGQLKDQVCSPGGTTIAGVSALEENGFRHAAISAVTAAKARADEMSASVAK